MKRFSFIILAVIALSTLAAGAFAITAITNINPGDMQEYNGTVIQNIDATAPKKSGAVCVSKVLTKGGTITTFNLYTSNRWYQKADWTVTKSDGTAYVAKRSLGNNTAYMPGSSGSILVNREYTTYKLATFSNASTAAASAGYTACQDRQ